MADTVHIEGLQALGQALSGLKADMQKKAARQAVAAGAGVVRAAARRTAPVDTGNLSKAVIMKRVPRTKLTEEYLVAVRHGKTSDIRKAKAGDRTAMGKDAYYARFIEFGTVKMPARPFMAPALSENVEKASTAMRERLRKRIAVFAARSAT